MYLQLLELVEFAYVEERKLSAFAMFYKLVEALHEWNNEEENNGYVVFKLNINEQMKIW